MAESAKGLNILCIDGGGARGLSSLVVIREIMYRINSRLGKGDQPQPYQYFDMIAGTGTGGISACMLGRLRMTIDQSIQEYAKVVECVFSEKKMNGPTMYKRTKLQEALKRMIQNTVNKEGEMMKEAEAKDGCRTLVFAMAKHNLTGSIPVMFRSYEAAANPGPNCTIWQALYATMAHPELFKGIDILDSSVSQSFIGGEVGCSNPLAHALSEVNRIFPDRQVSCIVSIGAGHAHTIQLPDPSWWKILTRKQDIGVMKDMATDSERVAQEIEERFQDASGVYFRFNVDQGMQSMKNGCWEQLGEVMQHTHAYIKDHSTNQKMEEVTRAIVERRCAFSTAHAAGRIPGRSDRETEAQAATFQQSASAKRCPAPTLFYTGRTDENLKLMSCISGGRSEQRVCVVYGLGGVGKTQLVLKVIERTRNEWDHILFVDASSNATAERDLKDFAIANGIGETHQGMIRWLEACRERWLVVLDNADTPSTKIQNYIPGGQHGSVIITTRLPDLARLASGPQSVYRLSSMSDADGLSLLMKITCSESQGLPESELSAAAALLEDCGCLALAIVHAGAYIAHTPSMTFGKYRDLFMSQQQRMLEQYRDLPASAKLDEYGQTVYTTWRMCYDQLKLESRPILWLISYLHYSHISEDIFQRAARRMHRKRPLPLSERESHAHDHVKALLSPLSDLNENWDTVAFANVMADLASFSLVTFDRTSRTYSIHVLVQDWARTVIPQEPEFAIECSATLVSRSIDRQRDIESLAFKRRLAPHVTSLLERRPNLGVNHTCCFGTVFGSTGQWREREKIELEVMEAFKRELGEDHKRTLSSMAGLALTYRELGRLDEAEKLMMQLVELEKRNLGEEHHDTLVSMSNLAGTYATQHRWIEAEQLFTQVLGARRQRYGEEHPHTLGSMSELAKTYADMGRWNEAEQLLLQVLDARKRVLGEEHPSTLGSMAKLGTIYFNMGRWDEAISLLTTASTVSQVELGPDHPSTRHYLTRLAEAKEGKPT